MLEFCDRGNLQDAVDRGVFAGKRADPDSDEPPPRNVPAVVYAPRPKTAPQRAMSRLPGAVLRESGLGGLCKRHVVAQHSRNDGLTGSEGLACGMGWPARRAEAAVGACVRRQTAREIASALTYLHSLDILHGDLSGGNILLASSNKDVRGFVAKARSLLWTKRPAGPGVWGLSRLGACLQVSLPAVHGCCVPNAACHQYLAHHMASRRWQTLG